MAEQTENGGPGRVKWMLGAVGAGMRAVAADLWWWLSGAGRLWWRYKIRATIYLQLVIIGWLEHLPGVVLVLLAPVIMIGLWARLGPVSYLERLVVPVARWRVRRSTRRDWPLIMESCGLARRVTSGQGGTGVEAPGLGRLRWEDDRLIGHPRLLPGQTVDDVEAAADRLRVCLGADRITIIPNPSLTGCAIAWGFGDPLAEPVPVTVPGLAAALPNLDAVPVGLTEDGRLWLLSVRVSTFGVGCSGSGKSGLMQGVLVGIAPAIRAGLVEVCGVDLKGGMELAMSRPLFTRFATTAGGAVAMLEQLVADLQGRADRQAGITRQHTPTLEEPLVLVLVDELAALVAYQPDRDLLRRAETALSVLLSQGRAVGFVVLGFVQDPRKETVKMRHLFLQAVALRLREREEVTMALSEGAVAGGAWCHKIPPTMPGVGYVLGEDGRPVRVRAGHVTDELIRDCADRFPAPRQLPTGEPAQTSAVRGRSGTGRRTSRASTPETSLVGEE